MCFCARAPAAPPAKVRALADSLTALLFGRADASYRALHLRRGDKCLGAAGAAAPVRCGPVQSMGFLSEWRGRGERGPRRPLAYVRVDG